MVIVLTLPEGSQNINYMIDHYNRSYGRRLQEMTYADLLSRGSAPRAAYVLGDRNRMNPLQRKLAGAFRRHLEAGGAKTWNNPERQLGRVGLLKKLFNEGDNLFNVYRMDDDRSEIQFPAFVRVENDHHGPRTKLCHTHEELDREIQRVLIFGTSLRNVLIEEFQDTRSPDGYFRKYSAWRIGESIIAQHCFLSEDWVVKHPTDGFEQARKESDDYHLENPHADLVKPLFDLAGIEYGRIDYGFTGKRIQVWEINDNPRFVTPGQQTQGRVQKDHLYMAAFDAMGAQVANGPPIDLDPLMAELKELAC